MGKSAAMSASPQRLLPAIAGLTAVAAAAALAAPADRWLPAALWHLVFAVGALPMILAAMGYFVPVLTRSGETPRLMALAPLTALAAGLAIVGHFLHGVPALRLAAPWLGLLAVAGFAAWLQRRWRNCLGHPNPCLAWYAGALGLLALGLLAVAIAPHWPEQTRALRVIHLHLNTLGFMGLTALGTLQVLLPTVVNRPDPEAATRLVRDLKWSIGGALAIALGSATAPTLALAGAAAYAWPLARLLGRAWRIWRHEILAPGTTFPLLVAASTGLALVLGHGTWHGLGKTAGAEAIPLFIVAFLLPLVSGAAGHLLPVWLRPGVQGPWHAQARLSLARGARARAGLLLAAGVLAAQGATPGYAVGALAAAWLVLGMLAVALKQR